jgi:hypothetical protein
MIKEQKEIFKLRTRRSSTINIIWLLASFISISMSFLTNRYDEAKSGVLKIRKTKDAVAEYVFHHSYALCTVTVADVIWLWSLIIGI